MRAGDVKGNFTDSRVATLLESRWSFSSRHVQQLVFNKLQQEREQQRTNTETVEGIGHDTRPSPTTAYNIETDLSAHDADPSDSISDNDSHTVLHLVGGSEEFAEQKATDMDGAVCALLQGCMEDLSTPRHCCLMSTMSSVSMESNTESSHLTAGCLDGLVETLGQTVAGLSTGARDLFHVKQRAEEVNRQGSRITHSHASSRKQPQERQSAAGPSTDLNTTEIQEMQYMHDPLIPGVEDELESFGSEDSFFELPPAGVQLPLPRQVSDEFTWEFLQYLHGEIGHFGGKALHTLVSPYIRSPRLRALCLKVRAECRTCIEVHGLAPRKRGQRGKHMRSEKPFQSVGVDCIYLVGTWILTMMCEATSWFLWAELPDGSSESAWNAFNDTWIKTFGVPLSFRGYIKTDHGSEFKKTFSAKLKELGCVRQVFTPTGQPQSHGLIEGRHAPFKRLTDAALLDADLPPEEWRQVIARCASLLNMLPSMSHDKKSAYERLTHHRLLPASLECLLDDFRRQGPKAVSPYDLQIGDRVFWKNPRKRFRSPELKWRLFEVSEIVPHSKFLIYVTPISESGQRLSSQQHLAHSSCFLPVPANPIPPAEKPLITRRPPLVVDNTALRPPQSSRRTEGGESDTGGESLQQCLEELFGRSSYFSQAQAGDVERESEKATGSDRPQGKRPQAVCPAEHEISEILLTAVGATHMPVKYNDLNEEGWKGVREARQKELNKFDNFEVFDKTNINEVNSAEAIILQTLWVDTLKLNDEGEREFKSRWCIRGDKDPRKGLEVSTETCPAENIRLMLMASISTEGFEESWIRGTDVDNAFLQSLLLGDTPVYIRPSRKHPDYGQWLWRLLKAMYGLREAPLCFEKHLQTKLPHLGWELSGLHGIWWKLSEDGTPLALMAVYVDDLLIASLSGPAEPYLKEIQEYELKYDHEGKPYTFCNKEGYVQSLPDHNISAPVLPVPESLKRSADESRLLPETRLKKYQEELGQLNYLAGATRPDIALGTSTCSQWNAAPTEKAHNALKRLTAFTKATAHRGLVIPQCPRSLPLHAETHTDASFGTPEHPEAQIGWVLLIRGCPLGWKSVKPHRIARSTTAAEALGSAEGLDHLSEILPFLERLWIQVSRTIWSDSNDLCSLMANRHPSPAQKSLGPEIVQLREENNIKVPTVALQSLRQETQERKVNGDSRVHDRLRRRDTISTPTTTTRGALAQKPERKGEKGIGIE
uniref:Integrase catalytic domain-containing protein n=1 Tax=Chromera velia CCMP2878 TaxID=1169474 RepID=A0A0G4F7Q8_9ALVE|eukprot:Cvel_2899.t1-p1 / transcript=Cvel_2899.t1 / gene=Cvel_2899 / organism=Chromera_velia_CCMP2878 / gene_product=Putative transposon Ty5-1 protein YCL074W, putative / transcript_product=Putative transposon Ty5-1 protein YCL074W, putative / location=Cvel_scaffold114:124869-130110(-) / protein_length=1221 / sequence_SO=supercontig / SO=protein_coding / is_pseudo=false